MQQRCLFDGSHVPGVMCEALAFFVLAACVHIRACNYKLTRKVHMHARSQGHESVCINQVGSHGSLQTADNVQAFGNQKLTFIIVTVATCVYWLGSSDEATASRHRCTCIHTHACVCHVCVCLCMFHSPYTCECAHEGLLSPCVQECMHANVCVHACICWLTLWAQTACWLGWKQQFAEFLDPVMTNHGDVRHSAYLL
jgi:hypothetical protein